MLLNRNMSELCEMSFSGKCFQLLNVFENQVNMQLLLILTIATLNYTSQSSLPKVPYIKALDVWFLGE